MAKNKIRDIENKIFELMKELQKLQKVNVKSEVKNYVFSTLNGNSNLLDFFEDKDKLLVIHNMGQGCRYCTLWCDGINSFLPHLESVISVILVSKDSPKEQRRFANDRNWNFKMASHNGKEYMKDQVSDENYDNAPGAVLYQRKNNKIYRKNDCAFGPGDIYCSIWSFLSLAGISDNDWTPQFSYWKRPEKLDDGGKNII